MNKLLSLIIILSAADLFAARSLTFGVDAFNEIVPANARGNVVFSPLSFEFDSVIMADAFEPITKAHFAETLGVLSDLPATYEPLINYYREVASTNGITFLAARAFLVPDYEGVSANYRAESQRHYDAEIALRFPTVGPENWFRLMLDGYMEDFEYSPQVASQSVNSFYDVLAVQLSCSEDAKMDTAKYPNFTLARIPLKGDAFLFLAIPCGQASLETVRRELSAEKVAECLTVFESVTVDGVERNQPAVDLPMMRITSELDMTPAMLKFKFPTRGYLRLNGEIQGRYFSQFCRLEIPGKNNMKVKPFAFFVYHKPTNSLLVMGQYTGD